MDNSEALKKALEDYFKSKRNRKVKIVINPNGSVELFDCGTLFPWEIKLFEKIGLKYGFSFEIRACLYDIGNLNLFFSNHFLEFKFRAETVECKFCEGKGFRNGVNKCYVCFGSGRMKRTD